MERAPSWAVAIKSTKKCGAVVTGFRALVRVDAETSFKTTLIGSSPENVVPGFHWNGRVKFISIGTGRHVVECLHQRSVSHARQEFIALRRPARARVAWGLSFGAAFTWIAILPIVAPWGESRVEWRAVVIELRRTNCIISVGEVPISH